MPILIPVLALFSALSFLLPSLYAGQSQKKTQPHACTRAQIDKAEQEVDHLITWEAVFRWHSAYSRCELADAGEGYSEAIARLLADHWDSLNEYFALAERDRSLHIALDTTMDGADLEKIKLNARRRCPTGHDAFCAALVRDANRAIAEQKAQ